MGLLDTIILNREKRVNSKFLILKSYLLFIQYPYL